jgi:hypothetical protein
MGSRYSIIKTPLGNILHGSIYKTKVPIFLGYFGKEEQFMISDRKVTTCQSQMNAFNLKIDPGVTFQIVDLAFSTKKNDEPSLNMRVEILNNLHLSQVDQYFEPSQEYPFWKMKDILESNNKILNKILNKDVKVLFIKNLMASISVISFFKDNICRVKEDLYRSDPDVHKEKYLEKLA